MFWIPNPWDYHRNDGFFIMARDAERAKKILEKYIEKEQKENNWDEDDYFFNRQFGSIQWDNIKQIEGPIATAGGCDC